MGGGDAGGTAATGGPGDRGFGRLWAGATAAGLAAWALPFLLGLHLVEGTIVASELGLLLGVRTAAFLVAAPLAGVLADRRSRRAVVAAAGASAAAGAAAMAAGVGGSLVVPLAAAVLVGAGEGAIRPALQALVAEVVAPERRQRANAAMTLAVRVTVLAGPAAAALAATRADVSVLVGVVAALWLAAAVLPPLVASPAPAAAPGSLGAQLADGVREARRHRWLVAGLGALSAVIVTGYSVTSVALPIVSRDRFGGEAVLAACLTGYTAGALVGAVVMARWRPDRRGWWALAGLGAYAAAPLALLADAPAAGLVAAYVLVGVGIELFNVPWFTAVQREVRPHLLARVSSLDFLASYGFAPLGLALIAPAIDAFGLDAVLAACAAACLAAPLAAALVPGARRFAEPRAAEGG